MKRKRINPQITHVMADGKALSDEEFMAKPYVVVAEDNYEFHVKCNEVFDPNYWEKERMRKKLVSNSEFLNSSSKTYTVPLE